MAVAPSGKLRSISAHTEGYGKFNIRVDRRCSTVFCHYLMAYQKFGIAAFEKGIWIRHLNGNRLDASFDNIAIGSPSDNHGDMGAVARRIRSMPGGAARRRLTEDQVGELRKKHLAGSRPIDLALEYGLARSTVSYILRGITYTP